MQYELSCDECEFSLSTTERWTAYGTARDHEADHPTHIVGVYRE